LNIAAIVVTHNPKEEFLNFLNIIVEQSDLVVLVDNNSSSIIIEKIFQKKEKNLILVKNKDNLGLAKAQNQAIKIAIDANMDAVLLLDDDTVVDTDYVENMKKSFSNYVKEHESERIGIFASNFIDKNIGGNGNFGRLTSDGFETLNFDVVASNYILVSFVYSSGSLIPIEVFKSVGIFEESFFIDNIDTEFCLRLLKNKYKIIVTKKACLIHTVGEREKHKFLGLTIKPNFHSAKRKYYFARNGEAILKKYRESFPGYKRIFRKKLIHDLLGIILYEPNKWKKIVAVVKGINDGKKLKI
jgi:rhamnosyltransferase